jgi:hypothetical protein
MKIDHARAATSHATVDAINATDNRYYFETVNAVNHAVDRVVYQTTLTRHLRDAMRHFSEIATAEAQEKAAA